MKRGQIAARSLPAGMLFSNIDEMTEEIKKPSEMKNTPALVPEL
jgi:hypothetical protein